MTTISVHSAGLVSKMYHFLYFLVRAFFLSVTELMDMSVIN